MYILQAKYIFKSLVFYFTDWQSALHRFFKLLLGSKKSEKLAFLRGTLFLLRGLETSWDLRFSRCLAARSTWSWWWCIAHDGLKSIIKEILTFYTWVFTRFSWKNSYKKGNFAFQILSSLFPLVFLWNTHELYVTSRPKLNFGCYLTFKLIL